jgi:hypothetical protein
MTVATHLTQGSTGARSQFPLRSIIRFFKRWRLRAADPNFNAPAGLVAATARLMEAASILYPSENDRKVATRQHLQDTISHGIQHVVNADYTSADGRTTIVAR